MLKSFFGEFFNTVTVPQVMAIVEPHRARVINKETGIPLLKGVSTEWHFLKDK